MSHAQYNWSSFFIIFGITVPSLFASGPGNHIFGCSWVCCSLKTGATLKIFLRRHLIPHEIGNFSRRWCIISPYAVYKATKSKVLKIDAKKITVDYFTKVKIYQTKFCHLVLKTLHTLQRKKLNHDGLLSFLVTAYIFLSFHSISNNSFASLQPKADKVTFSFLGNYRYDDGN